MAAPVENSLPMEVPQRLYSVHVLEVASLRLVTAIEILSPVNKRKSHEAYEDCLRKRRALIRSDVLRGGRPLECTIYPARSWPRS